MIQTGTIAAVAVAFAKFLSVLMPGVTPDVFLPLGKLHLPGAADADPARSLASAHRGDPADRGADRRPNIRGVTLGAAMQTVFSVAKVGALAVLVLLGLTLFRQPDVAAANFSSFWGTGDWRWR